MRKNIIVTLLTLAALSAGPAMAQLPENALYQWLHKDGTPTYSPDPPPAGIKYVVVDADLNPLPVQPAPAATAATGGAPAPAPAALPAPQKAIPKWKPVRYAQDPNLANKTASQAPSAPPVTPAQESMTRLAPAPISAECLQLKRETQILESYFAEAKTAAEMDQAILKLQKKNNSFRQQCG
ncbi:MAG: hypothetical protein AAF404_15595 [Pseudomonadota bacterium]